MSGKMEIVGLRETMRDLRAMDKDLFFESVREIKAPAQRLADEINSGYSSSPFADRSHDGFAHNGRTGWAKRGKASVKYGGRKARSGEEWPLVRVIWTGAAGQMVDLAAEGNLADQLGRTPSRVIWPTADRMRDEILSAIKDAADAAAEKVNKRLGERH